MVINASCDDARVCTANQYPLYVSEAFRDQVHCADVVVGAKADVATEADHEAFRAWAADELYPAKSHVTTIAHGALSLDVLDVPCGPTAPALPTAHRAQAAGAVKTAGASGASGVGDAGAAGFGSGGGVSLSGAGPLGPAPIPTAVTPGKPHRVLGGTAEFKTAGWVFSREDVFARPRLIALFQSLMSEPRVKRFKGVVRVGAEWVMPVVVNDPDGGGGGGVVKLEPIAYRRDSRLEIIVMTSSSSSSSSDGGGGGGGGDGGGDGVGEENEGVDCAARAAAACDWDALEAAIKAAIQPPRAVKS